MTTPFTDPIWIASNDQLKDCCQRLRKAEQLAVDTEFMRTNTFYPKAALFQLFAGDRCYLVDPLPITDFAPLIALLSDPAVVKVFHACSEDLDVFNSFLGCVPTPLVDTQIAAGMLHYGASTSYAALVGDILGVSLEKGETRSDWLQRPLDAKQLHYAVQDVLYLLPLYHALAGQLADKQRSAWLGEDCAALVANARTPPDPHAYFPRIKSAWKLNPRELAVLRQLSHWREQQARERDLPRNHLLHERVLWSLAKQQPQSLADLKTIEGLEARKIRRFGHDLLDIIARAQALGREDHPLPLPGPLPPAQRDLMKALKARVAGKAGELQLAPEVLAKKADYDFIIRSGMNGGTLRLPERLQGWRREIIGESLLQLAKDIQT